MDAVAQVRAFNRFHTRFAGALDAHYLASELSLVEARLLYEIAIREAPLAAELCAALGLDPGYVSRILRRFESRGWIERGRGEDARRRPVRLTDAGRARFEALDAASRDQVGGRIGHLLPRDREMLVEGLRAVQALLGGTGEAGDAVGWSIRTFRPGDLAAIASRQAILYAEAYDWGRPMEILLGQVTTDFLRDFKPGREQAWIAERGGLMAGAVLLVDAGEGSGQLRLLHVEPWARGLGIGRALVDECIGFARAAGYARVRLWTHTVLESARRIYAAAGFRVLSTDVHDTFGRPEQGETWELALDGGDARAPA